jgi:Dolichyl-phosphate-mannose-protein mannosyltransferase
MRAELTRYDPRSLARAEHPGQSELVVVAGLLLVSALVQSWVVHSQRIPASSDQAVSALMAKHILERGEHPVFYWGSTYAGTVEPHYLAGVFALLGPTYTAYRIGLGILVLLTVLGVYLVTRAAFGRPAAICAAAYLAVPPFFFLYKGLTSDGHYDAFNLVVVATLLVAIRIDRALETGRPTPALLALLGAVIGIGWWINPITPPISAAAVAWVFLRRSPRPPLRSLLWLAGGVLMGSAPWWFWNLRNQWASLAASELGRAEPTGALKNLADIARHSFPLLAGGAPFRGGGELWPISEVLVCGVLLVLVAPAIWSAMRGRSRLAGLFLLAFGALVLSVIWSRRYVPTEPRFLFPYYILIPPLIGAGALTLSRRPPGRIAAVTCAAVLLAVHVCGLASEHRHLRNTATEVTAPLDTVLAALRQQRVRHVYTDYWTAYRVSFESREEIIATPIPGEEMVRYPPYQDDATRDPTTAIAVARPRASCLRSYLRESGSPYRTVTVDPYTVFLDLPGNVLDFVVQKNALPLPNDAYRVRWTLASQPTEIARGSKAVATVTVQNASACSWPPAVHVGYHWRPIDTGLPPLYDGGRELPGPIAAGATVTVPVDLVPPPSTGRYLLEYDMVFENVDWFSTRGGSTATVPVTIR